jgi:hypothetical protein
VTITLDYFEGRAAWKLDLEKPESFRSVELRFRIRLFRPPRGALMSSWLRLYDLPDQPYSVHRVLDLSDGACRRWLEAAAREQVIELMLPGYVRTLSIEEFCIAELVELGQIHIAQQTAPDGDKALETFLEIFREAMKERHDVERAWKAVDESLKRKPLPPPPQVPSSTTVWVEAPSSGSMDVTDLLAAAERHLAVDDLEAALTNAELAAGVAPTDPRGWAMRARVNLKARDWSGALRELNQLVALKPDDGWGVHQRVLCDARLIAKRVTWTGPRLGKALGELVGSAVKARATLVGALAVERRELGWAVMLIGLFALSRAFADSGRSDRAVVTSLIGEVAGPEHLDEFLISTLPSMEWLGRGANAETVALLLLRHVADDLSGNPRVSEPLATIYTDLYDAGADILASANPTRDDDVH